MIIEKFIIEQMNGKIDNILILINVSNTREYILLINAVYNKRLKDFKLITTLYIKLDKIVLLIKSLFINRGLIGLINYFYSRYIFLIKGVFDYMFSLISSSFMFLDLLNFIYLTRKEINTNLDLNFMQFKIFLLFENFSYLLILYIFIYISVFFFLFWVSFIEQIIYSLIFDIIDPVLLVKNSFIIAFIKRGKIVKGFKQVKKLIFKYYRDIFFPSLIVYILSMLHSNLLVLM
jgi:hypothetical protein